MKSLYFLLSFSPFSFVIMFTLEIYLLCFETFCKIWKLRPNLVLYSGQRSSCIYFPKTGSHSCNLMSKGMYPRKEDIRWKWASRMSFFQMYVFLHKSSTRAARRNKELNFCCQNAFELTNIDGKNLLSNSFPNWRGRNNKAISKSVKI